LSHEAYLDIETTGLSSVYSYITVIGIYLVADRQSKMVQLVGEDVTEPNLLQALENVETIFTYNGARFDLPFIEESLGVRIFHRFHHRDLMFDCWRCNLYGGFKVVETKLGINRELKGVNGLDAILLWRRYQNGDEEALKTLLKYNREDVINLKVLREKLKEHPLY